MPTTPKKSPAAPGAAAQPKKKRSPLALVGALLLVAAVCGAVAAGFVFSGGSAGESTVAKVSAGLDASRVAAAPAKHESGEADFECGKKCKAGGDEVCGTDGKTYLNECFFQNAKCKNASLDKVADWKGYNCPNTCKKQIACKEIGKYLCASDGNVYFGYCNLFVAQCLDPSVQEIECDKSIFDGVFGH